MEFVSIKKIEEFCAFVFSETSNKREIAGKQKMNDSNNISGRYRETHLLIPLFGKRGGQMKIRTCQ